MDSTEAAILRTVLYADVFNFPLTAREIHHFLIHHTQVPFEIIERNLHTSPHLTQHLICIDGYFVCDGRADLIAIRQQREIASQSLWPLAVRYGVWLSRLPFVRMVALTGALAMRNAASSEDDLDYLLITAPGRVWMARAFSIVLVRLARLQGIVLCPNYVLAETALEQNRKDLFIAHEVAQIVPLYGHDLYARLRAANPWVMQQLPNTGIPFYCEQEPADKHPFKQVLEWSLGGKLGDLLEQWEYQRKLRRFARDLRTPRHAAQLDDQHVKGHFNDHGYRVLESYHERLRQYGLSEAE